MELVDPILRIRMNNGNIYVIHVFSVGGMTMEHKFDDYVKVSLELYVEHAKIEIADSGEDGSEEVADSNVKRKLLLPGGK